MSTRVHFSALAIAASVLAVSSAASAQTSLVDQGWLPWQGCWRADGATATELLCIVPDGPGVKLITLEGGVVRAESRIVTDGRARAVKQEGCSGTELAHWSADGQRVFLSSDMSCEGGAKRRVTGVFAITGESEWLSAQSVAIDDQVAARSVRYFAAQPANLPASIASALRNVGPARAARAGMRVTVDADDITEAVNSIDAAAVEEWLTSTGQPFQLADNLQPQSGSTGSALDLVSRGSTYASDAYQTEPATREVVHIVERPTVVHHTTYVNTVYRSCWDPWFAGYVTIGHGVYVGIDRGYYGSCGRSYYSRYSPWGYDLWGWRHTRRPIIVVRNNTPIIHRPPPNIDWRRDRSSINRPYDNRGTVTGTAIPRTNTTSTAGTRGGQLTRGGYSSGSTTRSTGQQTNAGSGSRTLQATPRNSGGYVTRSTQASGAGYTRTPRPTSAQGGSVSQPADRSGTVSRPSQPSRESRGTAVPRSSNGGSRPSPTFRSAPSNSSGSSGSQSAPVIRGSTTSRPTSQPAAIRGTTTGRPTSQPAAIRAKPRSGS
ncbi:MAG: hypothetical protein WEE89_18915 [Gemmatimonadota bacterium]